jgi:protein TonB
MPRSLRVLPSAASARGRPWSEAALQPFDPYGALKIAFVISLTLHAVVLPIRFRLPEMAVNKLRESQLEVVLVNSKSLDRPARPQARAQANLDGGGNTEADRRPKSPLPALRERPTGDQLIESRQRAREAAAVQSKLVTPNASENIVAQDAREEAPPEPFNAIDGTDLARTALAMARMEAQISRRIEEYGKRPRKKFVGARVSEALEAQYVEDWRLKVERIGNLNYPESARGRLYGSLVMSVGIRSDGEVDSIEINKPSGHRVLDDAAIRIVRLGGPYGAFSPALSRKVDILVITRTWTFTNTDQLLSD